MAKIVRMTVLMRRKPGTSPSEFHKYWSETHGPIFNSLPAAQKHLVKYQRVCLSPPYLLSIFHLLSSSPDHKLIYPQFHILSHPSLETKLGLQTLHEEFDGAAEFWARSEEDLEAVFTSREYIEKAYPDEENFLDRSASRVLIGWEEESLSDGKVIN